MEHDYEQQIKRLIGQKVSIGNTYIFITGILTLRHSYLLPYGVSFYSGDNYAEIKFSAHHIERIDCGNHITLKAMQQF